MCARCDVPALLRKAGLSPTRNRLVVLSILTAASTPLSAKEIIQTLEDRPGAAMNRVTIYRILEALVERCVLTRLACPDRVDRFCLGETPLHPEHAHFYCQRCGSLRCLGPERVPTEIVRRKAAQDPCCGRIEATQVLLAGICTACLAQG